MSNYLIFFILATFWGGSFVAIKFAVVDCPSNLAAFLRVLIGMLFLTPVYILVGKKFTIERSKRRLVWTAGLFAQGIPFVLLFWGEKSISPGLAGIMNGTVPLWVFLMGYVYFKKGERFSTITIGGLILGFIGLTVVYSPLLREGVGSNQLRGLFAIFLMAVCYAISILMNRFILVGENKVDLYAGVYQQHLASCVFLAIVTLVSGQFRALPTVSLNSLYAILYLGICSTAIAFLLWFTLIREWGAVRSSTVTYVVPLVALFFDFLFFKAVPTVYEGVGAGLVLAGVFLVQNPKAIAVAKPPVADRE